MKRKDGILPKLVNVPWSRFENVNFFVITSRHSTRWLEKKWRNNELDISSSWSSTPRYLEVFVDQEFEDSVSWAPNTWTAAQQKILNLEKLEQLLKKNISCTDKRQYEGIEKDMQARDLKNESVEQKLIDNDISAETQIVSRYWRITYTVWSHY